MIDIEESYPDEAVQFGCTIWANCMASMDDPFPTNEFGNKSVLVVKDYFTNQETEPVGVHQQVNNEIRVSNIITFWPRVKFWTALISEMCRNWVSGKPVQLHYIRSPMA